jgi:mRNA interferase HigB
MHVISRKTLKAFWEIHADAEKPLQTWFHLVNASRWRNWDEVKQLFGKKVDRYRDFSIFDIGGNKYRLIAVINYQNQKVFIRSVLTHASYDRDDWKEDAFKLKRFGSKRTGRES